MLGGLIKVPKNGQPGRTLAAAEDEPNSRRRLSLQWPCVGLSRQAWGTQGERRALVQVDACARPTPQGPRAAGLTLHWHCPLVLLQSGSKPLLTSQWQGPHTGFPQQPLGHGSSILLGNHAAGGRYVSAPFWNQREAGGLGPDWPRSAHPPPL